MANSGAPGAGGGTSPGQIAFRRILRKACPPPEAAGAWTCAARVRRALGPGAVVCRFR